MKVESWFTRDQKEEATSAKTKGGATDPRPCDRPSRSALQWGLKSVRLPRWMVSQSPSSLSAPLKLDRLWLISNPRWTRVIPVYGPQKGEDEPRRPRRVFLWTRGDCGASRLQDKGAWCRLFVYTHLQVSSQLTPTKRSSVTLFCSVSSDVVKQR